MDRNDLLSGQIVLRESSQEVDDTDRKLMMVVGIISVPKDFELKGEHKYTVVGQKKPKGLEGLFNLVDPDFKMPKTFDELNLTIFPETAEDIHDETIGMNVGSILTQHRRWRV